MAGSTRGEGSKGKAAKSDKGGAKPSGDSPKRQGDKLEKARDAAAGRGKAS